MAERAVRGEPVSAAEIPDLQGKTGEIAQNQGLPAAPTSPTVPFSATIGRFPRFGTGNRLLVSTVSRDPNRAPKSRNGRCLLEIDPAKRDFIRVSTGGANHTERRALEPRQPNCLALRTSLSSSRAYAIRSSFTLFKSSINSSSPTATRSTRNAKAPEHDPEAYEAVGTVHQAEAAANGSLRSFSLHSRLCVGESRCRRR